MLISSRELNLRKAEESKVLSMIRVKRIKTNFSKATPNNTS